MRISIHALREEGDVSSDGQLTRPPIFLSTPSARRATRTGIAARTSRTDFYPRPPRGGRCCGMGLLSLVFGFLSTPSARRATIAVDRSFARQGISIHALREEGDPCRGTAGTSPTDFYPRPPRGGRRYRVAANSGTEDISIHALREEGDQGRAGFFVIVGISIHALREEGDISSVRL